MRALDNQPSFSPGCSHWPVTGLIISNKSWAVEKSTAGSVLVGLLSGGKSSRTASPRLVQGDYVVIQSPPPRIAFHLGEPL
jgi:hypothetical protein